MDNSGDSGGGGLGGGGSDGSGSDGTSSGDGQPDGPNYSPGPGDPNYSGSEPNYTPAVQGLVPDALLCQSPEAQASDPQTLNNTPSLQGDTPSALNLTPASQDGRTGETRPDTPADAAATGNPGAPEPVTHEDATVVSGSAAYSEVAPLRVVPLPLDRPAAPDTGAHAVFDGVKPTSPAQPPPPAFSAAMPADLSFGTPALTLNLDVDLEDIHGRTPEPPSAPPGPSPFLDALTSTTPGGGVSDALMPGFRDAGFGHADLGIPGATGPGSRDPITPDAGAPSTADPGGITTDRAAIPGDLAARRQALFTSGRDLDQEMRDRYGRQAYMNAKRGLDPSGRPVRQYTVPPPGLDERIASDVVSGIMDLLMFAPLIGAGLRSMGILVFADEAAARGALEAANSMSSESLLRPGPQPAAAGTAADATRTMMWTGREAPLKKAVANSAPYVVENTFGAFSFSSPMSKGTVQELVTKIATANPNADITVLSGGHAVIGSQTVPYTSYLGEPLLADINFYNGDVKLTGMSFPNDAKLTVLNGNDPVELAAFLAKEAEAAEGGTSTFTIRAYCYSSLEAP